MHTVQDMLGVDVIYHYDRAQDIYLDHTLTKPRGIKVDDAKRWGMFFVPNQKFIYELLGDESSMWYTHDGYCRVQSCIVIPVHRVDGKFVGWVSYNPFNREKALESGVYDTNYYNQPPTSIMEKGKYPLVIPQVYKRAVEPGSYIIVTDGVFDAVSLDGLGYNTMALLSSNVSPHHLFLLSFVDNVYVSMDNDEQGLALAKSLSSRLGKKVHILQQSVAKDVDALLQTPHCDAFVETLNECIAEKTGCNFKPECKA